MNGATPVFVEPDAYDNIDADRIQEIHIKVIHILINLIEKILANQE